MIVIQCPAKRSLSAFLPHNFILLGSEPFFPVRIGKIAHIAHDVFPFCPKPFPRKNRAFSRGSLARPGRNKYPGCSTYILHAGGYCCGGAAKTSLDNPGIGTYTRGEYCCGIGGLLTCSNSTSFLRSSRNSCRSCHAVIKVTI